MSRSPRSWPAVSTFVITSGEDHWDIGNANILSRRINMRSSMRLPLVVTRAFIVSCLSLLLTRAPAVAEEAGTTPQATKLGVSLEQSFDSSGPDAWDPKKHPLVFYSTEGPGYGGLLSGVTLPGVAIIDADTREPVASQHYDVLA